MARVNLTAVELVTKADFAGFCGVTRAAITTQCREGGLLAAAVVDGKINLRHPDAQAYEKRSKARGKTDAAPTKAPESRPEPTGMADDGSPEAAAALQDLTLRQIGERFGGLPQFELKVRALKGAEELRAARLRNDESDGSLIDRDLVSTHVFGLIDEANRRLLSDAARTITRQTYAAARSGIDLEKSEQETRKILSKVLELMKQRVAKALRVKPSAN